jgi:hypothetical protein
MCKTALFFIIIKQIKFLSLNRKKYVLKGQSHEKVGEIRPWDGSLGPN